MKAYVTSIGEWTTEICCEQLRRFGFEVVLLDGVEPWWDKYQKFIKMADEGCLRIDADVIVNENIRDIFKALTLGALMIQCKGYDFYRNDIGIISPIYYSERALKIIKENLDYLSPQRPEATAWRLPEINPFTATCDLVIGMHGFFQDRTAFDRALKNKTDRKQIEGYDFELADKLLKLNYEKNQNL